MKKWQYATLLLLCVSLGVCAKTAKGRMNIVFIGNSITQGAIIGNPAQDAPPAKTVAYLSQQPDIASVQFANCGVSGCTTVDYLPASRTLFPKAQAAADVFYQDASSLLLFSIMLGTNDSAIKGPNGSPVSAKQYQTNMKVIIDELLARYPNCRIVLNRPVWYSANTYNSAMYLLEGQKRLASYLPELETLVGDYARTHPGHVWIGDKEGWDYFKENYATDLFPESGNAGTFYLHPNEKGAARLGELWAKAILNVLRAGTVK